jgi:hypothetical protein
MYLILCGSLFNQLGSDERCVTFCTGIDFNSTSDWLNLKCIGLEVGKKFEFTFNGVKEPGFCWKGTYSLPKKNMIST